jgi:urease accessory protein
MLLNPTGGILGGDVLTTRVELAAGAHACLTTPSATRVYRTSRHSALQETRINLAKGAALESLPDHVIPSAGASFRQHLCVNFAPGARAILFDSFAAGRIAHGERWKFRDFDSRTEIFLEGKPVYLNRTLVEPFRRSPPECIALDEFNYVANAILVADEFQDWPRLLSELAAALDSLPAIYGGVSLLAHSGCVVRFLARTASDLVEANAALWKAARPLLLGKPAFDLRKY